MRKSLFVLFCFGLIVSFPAISANITFDDVGEIVDVRPRMKAVSARDPRGECWVESVPVQSDSRRDRSYAGPAIGGVTGAIVGNQVGKGSGKTAATAAGAIIGAIVGDNLSNHDSESSSTYYRQEARCRETMSTREVEDGYDVTILYQGREVIVRTREHPGYDSRVRMRVVATPYLR